MKKILICISMLFCLSNMIYAECNSTVPLNHKIKGTSHGGNPKNPYQPLFIDLDGYVITMSATPCYYTLNLYDEDGDLVYTTFVPAGTTQIVLPSTLSGNFEIRFETDTYYYYGYITL